MKGKILDSDFIPGDSSWVQKETKYGTFESTVSLLDIDKDIENSFDGCRMAEKKCDLQAYRERAKWMRERYNGARIMYDNLRQYWQEDNLVLQDMRRQLDYLKREWYEARETADRMKDYYPHYVETIAKERRSLREKIKKSKSTTK